MKKPMVFTLAALSLSVLSLSVYASDAMMQSALYKPSLIDEVFGTEDTLQPMDLFNLQRKTAAGIRYFPELSFFETLRPGETQKTTMAIMAVYPNGHERRATITREGKNTFSLLLGDQGNPTLKKDSAGSKDELLSKLTDFFGKQ